MVTLKETFSTGHYSPSPVGEVELYFASGIPEHISKKKGMDSVSIQPEGAKYPISGLINPGENILKIIDMAEEKEIPLLLRFEQKRKSGLPLDVPIKNLKLNSEEGKKNTVKMCVGIYDYNTKSWILSSEAKTDPSNDPSEVKTIIHSAKDIEVDENQFFAEKKPFIPLTEKFHKQQQLITMYFFVKEQENKHNYNLTDENRVAVARNVLKTADAIQKFITKSDVVNYNGYEHTRARALIFNLVEHFHPITEEVSNDILKWQQAVWMSATKLLTSTEE